jgi:hypothetical protein
VYRYVGAASRLSGSQSAAHSFRLSDVNPKGIVTDGLSLWVVNAAATDKVFKYTLTGTLLGSWAIDAANAAPTGITIDPANPQHVWIVDNSVDRVFQYSNSVGRISGRQNANAEFRLADGNTNPQDIADPPAAGVNSSSVALHEGTATKAFIEDSHSPSGRPDQTQVGYKPRGISGRRPDTSGNAPQSVDRTVVSAKVRGRFESHQRQGNVAHLENGVVDPRATDILLASGEFLRQTGEQPIARKTRSKGLV